MKIVLDTNCFISCIGKRSPYRNVFDRFLNEGYTLCLSTEVLLEYEEIFIKKWGMEVAENLLSRLLNAKNIEFLNIFYNFRMVFPDLDDNKFADLYIASNSDFLISNDTQLLALQGSNFPKFQVLKLQEFSSILYSH